MNQKLPIKPQKNKQLNFKVPEDFYWKLKNFASSKRIKMLEVLARAFKFYEKKEAIISEINTYHQLLGVNNIQEIKTFLANRTLPRMDYDIKDLANKVNIYRQTIQAIEQQMQTFQGRMNWPELEAKINHLNPTYFNKIGLVITYQTLKETLEESLRVERMLRQKGVLF
jgi:hypothetical protein